MRLALALALAALASADPTLPVDIFVPGGNIADYRIPALVSTRTGALIAIAEARTTTTTDCCHKWLVARRSVDNGTTWGPITEIWGSGLPKEQGAGNPAVVYDNTTDTIILHGSVSAPGRCNPTLWNFQITSTDDGLTWGNLTNITAFLAPYAGATPGPGTGTQLGPNSPWPGRLVIAAHYGAYRDDVSWYSDDQGTTWTLSTPALGNLDEVVVAALPSGRVLLNARTDHYNASCDCRAFTYSDDGGASWQTPVQWDPVLIEPVCQGSLVTLGPLTDSNGGTALFFSNPASTTERADITVRRSDDEGTSWRSATWLVQGGEVWGGYSCIAGGMPYTRADKAHALPADQQYGAIMFERNHAANGTAEVNVISFSMFPVDMPPQPAPPLNFISASDPAVAWEGRHVVLPTGDVAFDFPGVTARVTVAGASYFKLAYRATCSGRTIRLESSIDGAPLNTHGAGSFWIYSAPYNITVASGLYPHSNHTLKVRLATEARNGACYSPMGSAPDATSVVFAGVWTDGTPVTLPPPPAVQRRIEFVGDSITAGAADNNPGSCSSMPAVQDPSIAASLGYVCPNLNASCAIVAVSGDTVLTPNPPIVDQSQKPPLPLIYNRSRTYVPATGEANNTWDVSAFVPDAVVLNLGTNDAAAGNFATDYELVLAAFIAQISGPTGAYARAGLAAPHVLAFCGPMTDAYCAPMAAAVTNATGYLGAKASFLGFVNATLDGCDGHPGRVGQAQMGAALTTLIRDVMGW